MMSARAPVPYSVINIIDIVSDELGIQKERIKPHTGTHLRCLLCCFSLIFIFPSVIVLLACILPIFHYPYFGMTYVEHITYLLLEDGSTPVYSLQLIFAITVLAHAYTPS